MGLHEILNKVKKYLIALALGLAAILAGISLIGRGCRHDPAPGLEEGVAQKIVVEGRKVRITTKKGTTEHFVPDTAEVTVREDGEVNVSVRKFGAKYELGGGFGMGLDRVKLVLDTRIVYAWRLSLHGGLTLDPSADKLIDVARPLVFIAYPLPFRPLPNTSVWLGRELPGDWMGGFRVRF